MKKQTIATLATAGVIAGAIGIHSVIASNEIPTVYFTRDISPEGLVKAYNALNWTPKGKVGIKMSTGESLKTNYLRPELIKELVAKVDGTIVECNTAYAGNRNTSEAHWAEIKKRGFLDIAPVDI
ncbi:MAG: ferredoxin, partial [Alphaproteobacteria bacterium]|nr:ferredoxin [Alphaproteobacteria bacterium]